MGINLGKEEKEDYQLEISNILLDEKSLKFPLMKIKYDDFDTKIHSISIENKNKDINIKDIKDILSKEPAFKCSECQNVISSFEFFIKQNSIEIIICNDCHNKLIEKEKNVQYISFDNYISTCDRHEKKFESYCKNCNRNICSDCIENHQNFGQKHEFFNYENILDEKEIKQKVDICHKVKSLSQIYKSISEIRLRENKLKASKRYLNISERFSRENKYSEIIISTFDYFLNKKSLCYEIISNFNEIKYNKALDDIDIKAIFDATNQFLEPSFHIIKESPDMIEKNRIKIIPISERNRIYSDKSLGSEIRGIIELKGGYYLAGSMEGNIGIFEQEHLELKQVFKLEGISNIYHLEKIKHDNLDLIAVASNLNELIVISVFHNEKEIEDKDNKENKDKKEVNFNYKFVFRKAEHTGKLNRIIQLSNGLVVSSAEDKLVIFWQVIKKEKDEGIILQSITKVEMNRDVHVLIECPFTNELICNDKTIDLKTLLPKRELDFRLEGKHFNCSICLFKDKYLGYVDFCDGISILNIENEKNYYVTAKYDYVDAIYSIDNETFCLCTKNLYDMFGLFGGRGLTQQFKLNEDVFVEIGDMIPTGICNCYMTDSKNNFIMGTMSGILNKFSLK